MEEVQQNFVTNAIKKRHEVSFKYDSGDGDTRGKQERITVQPVAYGETKAGNPCFRAYQTNGSSESYEKGEGDIPGWRLFILNKVVDNSWKDTGKIFSEPPGYNKDGDKTMSQVLVKADFEGSASRYERGGLKRYNDERHKQNVEKNPFYDFEKQAKKKQMAPDYVMRNIKDTQKTQAEREQQWAQAMKAANRGNNSSINDMARQKDFGDNNIQQTVGPKMKNKKDNVVPKNNMPNNYANAAMNGPQYKNSAVNNLETQENNETNDEYRQRIGSGTETDA